jgi:hypothetical protein
MPPSANGFFSCECSCGQAPLGVAFHTAARLSRPGTEISGFMPHHTMALRRTMMTRHVVLLHSPVKGLKQYLSALSERACMFRQCKLEWCEMRGLCRLVSVWCTNRKFLGSWIGTVGRFEVGKRDRTLVVRHWGEDVGLKGEA